MSRPPSVVVLAGDLDVYTVKRVRAALDPVDGPAIVDMSAVEFLDAAALGELARLARRVGTGTVVLVVPSPQIRRVLDIVRFDRLFRIVTRMPDARGA